MDGEMSKARVSYTLALVFSGSKSQKNSEEDSPGGCPGGRMDRTNLDDPSAYYMLGHGAVLGANDKSREVQVETGWVRGVHQDRENEAHFRESLASGLFDWLIEYMKRDPKYRDNRPAEREYAAYTQYFRIRAGAHERVRTYIEVHRMDLPAAIMKAESDITEAEDLEDVRVSRAGEEAPDIRGPWPQSKTEALMRAPVEPKGGGSKSKSRKSNTKPDAPVVENALRKGMAA